MTPRVISYDMPVSLASYIHRVGRTARASKYGDAITLVGHQEARWFWNDIVRAEKTHRSRKSQELDKTSYVFDEEDNES